MNQKIILIILFSIFLSNAFAQELSLPPRPEKALTGTEVVELLTPLPLAEREEAILNQVNSGNVPNFMRSFVPVVVAKTLEGKVRKAVYYVAPDYLCLGSDQDYFHVPMTPMLGQQIADTYQCCLPTPKMVNDIWAAAPVKLAPATMTPDEKMTTIPVFAAHFAKVWAGRSAKLESFPLGKLTAGHQKDVVVTLQLKDLPGRVAIYGWHYPDGKPIQPVYTRHFDSWVDYSHGIRLVQLKMKIDGRPTTVPEVLANPVLAPLLSDEGVFAHPRYTIPETETPEAKKEE